MEAGILNPNLGLSKKYDYTFIKAKLMCGDYLEDFKVLYKEYNVTQHLECMAGVFALSTHNCILH